MEKDGLFCFIIICNFDRFENPFATIAIVSEFYFRFRRFILLVQTKEMISINHGSSTSCWKPWRWVRFDVILMIRDICINSNLRLTKFTSSSRSTEFKHILPWNISQIITKAIPICPKIVISYVIKWGIPL